MLVYGVSYKRRFASKQLPVGDWNWRGVVWQQDFRLSKYSKLRAKVLVFNCKTNRDRFAEKFVYGGCVRGASGAAFYCTDSPTGKPHPEQYVDRVYFGVLAIDQSQISLDTVAHECVHLASAYSLRTQNRVKWPGHKTDPDEAIAWPTGILTGKIWAALVRDCVIGPHLR